MDKVALSNELPWLPSLTDTQRREIAARLAHHRAHPDEPGATLDDIRRKLIST